MSTSRVAPEPPAAEEAAPSTAELTAPSTANVPYVSGCEQNVGDRRQQEDTFVQFDDLNKIVADLAPSVGRDVRRAFWAVYDGFGGQSSSLWLKSHLHEHLVCHALFERDPAAALAAVFAEADAKLLEYNAARDAERGAGGGANFVRTGSCATVCLLVGNTLHVANVGDSRTVLYRRKGAPLMLTDEHKASLESERQRVAAAGGDTVQRTQEVPGVCCFPGKVEKLGPVRVQPGGLAVSRAFGAGHAKLAEHGGKPGVVIHEPSVQRATLSGDDDLCLVLASDGVWDNVKRLADLSPDLRTQILQAEQYRAVARHAAEAVVGYALRHAVNEGQQDNTTALVVVLGAQAELALSERRGGGDG